MLKIMQYAPFSWAFLCIIMFPSIFYFLFICLNVCLSISTSVSFIYPGYVQNYAICSTFLAFLCIMSNDVSFNVSFLFICLIVCLPISISAFSIYPGYVQSYAICYTFLAFICSPVYLFDCLFVHGYYQYKSKQSNIFQWFFFCVYQLGMYYSLFLSDWFV